MSHHIQNGKLPWLPHGTLLCRRARPTSASPAENQLRFWFWYGSDPRCIREERRKARSTVQCSAVQCSTVQCSTVQCSAVQCTVVSGPVCKYTSPCGEDWGDGKKNDVCLTSLDITRSSSIAVYVYSVQLIDALPLSSKENPPHAVAPVRTYPAQPEPQ